MALSDAPLQVVIDRLEAQLIWDYTNLVGCTFATADFLQTFEDEVQYMWTASLSIPKVLFFIARYSTLVNNVLGTLAPGSFPGGSGTPEDCLMALLRPVVGYPLLILAAEGILFYRVYAFSGKSRKMLAYLVVQFLAIHTVVLYFNFKWFATVKFTRWILPTGSICMMTESNSAYFATTFEALLVSVTSAMLIMVVIAYRVHRGLNSKLLTAFYRDGIFYFICLAAVVSANVVENWLGEGAYKFIFIAFEMNLHGILSTRMLLHLRKIGSDIDNVSITRLANIRPRSCSDSQDLDLPHHPPRRPLTNIRFNTHTMDNSNDEAYK
ncbi:hypothetical protein D9611_010175 [Ephemerocybe angulata]|uniref:DUF6533 domain-containing protein n=1 Tax=Ephemerocybe angulata TaxID=980116 RepID=A0A8H5EV04_9AGAR|nr:hypothetical protein D9611_010175 [Tulosesus angulatus]